MILDKEELQKVIDLYIKERSNFVWLISIEEFYNHYVRHCECCNDLVLLEERDEELEIRETWRKEKLHCCESCCEVIDNF